MLKTFASLVFSSKTRCEGSAIPPVRRIHHVQALPWREDHTGIGAHLHEKAYESIERLNLNLFALDAIGVP